MIEPGGNRWERSSVRAHLSELFLELVLELVNVHAAFRGQVDVAEKLLDLVVAHAAP